jgi:multidrug resistance efflux pump
VSRHTDKLIAEATLEAVREATNRARVVGELEVKEAQLKVEKAELERDVAKLTLETNKVMAHRELNPAHVVGTKG